MATLEISIGQKVKRTNEFGIIQKGYVVKLDGDKASVQWEVFSKYDMHDPANSGKIVTKFTGWAKSSWKSKVKISCLSLTEYQPIPDGVLLPL